MADIDTTTVSEEGFASQSQIGDFELSVDPGHESGPDPNQVLVADYASCFLPALRVGAQQRDHDDLGQIQIDAEADLDDEDDIEAIRFNIEIEEELDDDELDELVDRGEDICHVHAALRDELNAEISAEGGAF